MSQNLTFVLRQAHSLEDACTHDMFKRTEELLCSDMDFQHSLEFVGSRKDMDRYNSMVDFLFCELVLGYRKKCFLFYEGKERPLREHAVATKEQVAHWDAFLVEALHVARQRFNDKRSASWKSYREEVLAKAAA